ncbi:pyrimidine 5-nucleotidase [Auriscalpium vulgare]|uniref:Pyrimidine 5-nucleotidase n=1 Tax=Auriscalpium vulgare TaxID=40419 RepID=A0ACB8SB07_9AGAM|nr:pyrimidine 5-nucleotidase [Auriscalpium vulgare]
MSTTQDQDDRIIVFFDIDNTLYSASSKIAHAMGVRIHAYFISLGLDESEANELHLKYYTQYGLAVRGLVRHHNVDPLDFDEKCDGSLPLEDMLKPDPRLRQLFQDIDRSKARVWALTNAYRPHAERVLRILNLHDQVEGLIFCDYREPNFVCKPEREYYVQAMEKAGVRDPARCFFVDDSRGNIEGSRRVGWQRVVHFREEGLETMEGGRVKQLGNDVGDAIDGKYENGIPVISDLQQLRTVWPEIFKSPTGAGTYTV